MYLKLIPQAANATEPADVSIWSAGAPLVRKINGKVDSLGGIAYTIWNDGKTLRTNSTNYQFMGDLTADYNYKDACDVVFIVPTDHDGITSFDPNRTLTTDRGRDDQAADGKINGKIGTGFLGMTYREVYMLDIPRENPPKSYTNASVVTFNTTNKQKSWSNGQIKCDPGHAAYAFADDKHKPTTRTLFRLYMLDDPINSCIGYFFATNVQDFKKYRNVENPKTSADSTVAKKIYSWDHLTCMEAVDKETSPLYKTDYMYVPALDSTYYYVGYNNDYKAEKDKEKMGTPGAYSQFEKIRTLPMKDLAGKYAPANAYGRMVVDTSSTDPNLGVKFEPKGYFLKVSTGTNVPMKQDPEDPNRWISEEMWTITPAFAELYIKTTLMTGSEFDPSDSGADVDGWSTMVQGKTIRVVDSEESCEGKSGWARIYTNNTVANGAMEFVLANNAKHIHYDNNGFLGMPIPDQYPVSGSTTVTVLNHRLKGGYTFNGWNTQADGNGTSYTVNQVVDLASILPEDKDSTLTLYAQATYNGTLQVAISFINPADDKRYFITHPNSSAPRYARARHFDNWETTWQGMENAENLDPNYISTFEVRCPINEIKRKQKIGDVYIDDLDPKEHVLDPRSYTMKGYEDSLTFYEFFHPADDEYLGLYYTTPNTILANNTWAGLFTTTATTPAISWPDYKTPYISGVKLKSERYVEEYDPVNKKDSLELKVRSNSSEPWVKYDTDHDKFDGVATQGAATTFDVSAVVVADAHYVVIPDTSEVWRDAITFGYHENEQTVESVWSKLIGKQFLACMRLGDDTVYFHPNRNKIIDDPNNLYLSSDFRVTQTFNYIRDSRVSAPLNEGDSVMHETTDHYWHHNIVSGKSSPRNVKDADENYIDIVDTFRITLSHGGISKIKEYRGRWKAGAPGLKPTRPTDTRYRDIIVTTKTYHEGGETTKLVLKPVQESYSFSPLAGVEKQIDFLLIRETLSSLLDKDNVAVSTVVTKRDTINNKLTLSSTNCSLKGSVFDIVSDKTTTDHVTLATHAENTSGVDYDTLTVTIATITVDDVTYTDVTAKVPLVQATLTGKELLWSVVDGGKRYFIQAGSGGLIFRQYTQRNSTLYKINTTTHLIKGAADADNNNNQYITPWVYTNTGTPNQLTLATGSPVNKAFVIISETTPGVGDPASPTALTYEFVNTYTNENANYEEQVKLQYGGRDDGWLKFSNGALSLTTKDKASTFSWSYFVTEYSLLNNGTYPSQNEATFQYNSALPQEIQTRYKAYREYSTLLNNTVTYLCRYEQIRIDSLTDAGKQWKTSYEIDTIRDRRIATESELIYSTDDTKLTTTIHGDESSPTNVTYGGKYINIVDTLRVRLSLKDGAPAYRFKGDWSEFKSISDANLKIPLIRKTYHTAPFDSLLCSVDEELIDFAFPATITTGKNDEHEYVLHTTHRHGIEMVDVENQSVAVISSTTTDLTSDMDLTDKALAEIRLVDEYGNKPDWCEISETTENTITVKCTKNGVRSPRSANLYLAYIIMVDDDGDAGTPDVMRFVNYRLTVSQVSSFTYANNQVLVHSNGASGDEKMADGRQQAHENKRILYYYPDQDVELPVRERAFYGWWRWYREGVDIDSVDVSDSDVPDSLWRRPPTNTGKYNFPFRIIGDSVWKDTANHALGKKLVTMGRWTVFHYKSKDYGNKNDPPAKNPRVAPPAPIRKAGADHGKPSILTYAVDISNYYDNLPMSVSHKNQVDTALMDTILEIIEPTLSLRETFELHPWTEMADTLWNYRSSKDGPFTDDKYMEDHVMMAPTGAQLLLQTEQRYNLANLTKYGHSESLLGYYMRDDNWEGMSPVKDDDGWSRQDSMIWCGGWDADCKWYIYNPKAASAAEKYTLCTHPISEEEDFLKVPAHSNTDTVYYCLRARSKKTTGDGTLESPDVTIDGDYFYNICRYKICYHQPAIYGPLKEDPKKGKKAIITKDEIEQRYDVLERLDFDYIQPGSDYHIYPHPLPWADASYGYSYPETSSLPHNRYHDQSDFPNHGEYGLINRIPYTQYWRTMEQHGGAANGYMIYCDGMASAGQVAALSLNTNLCAGQKMFFSGYVGNPSSQKDKANPNFIFSVQGSKDGVKWKNITSYMTGDIPPSDQWYQIYFPIIHNEVGDDYHYFRVRIYNVAANFDGNDFIIDDMCIFATKPPLIAYQAQTTCSDYGKSEAPAHVLLRVDYQGITGDGYNGNKVCYAVRQKTPAGAYSFVEMSDHYIEEARTGTDPDTLYGKIYIPARDYEPQDKDSIYKNMNDLLDRYDTTLTKYKDSEPSKVVREGYIYEILEGDIRPVKYIVHTALMKAQNDYTVHMSAVPKELLSSICGMTSHLKISNRMVLELNGEEQPETEQLGLCANATYDIGLIVKGSMYQDSVPPIDVTGTCFNDWLLYGDTAAVSSQRRYGYKYKDILAVVQDILRYEPKSGETNRNQFAPNLSSVSRNEMQRIKTAQSVTLETTDHPYDVLAHLVNNGFLILYKQQLTASVMTGDSVQFVILPILGTGSKEVADARVEVCPNPILIILKPSKGGGAPLMVGGLNRDSTESTLPVNVLVNTMNANTEIKLRVDSIMPRVGIYSIDLRSTDDPEFREGVHQLHLVPDRRYPSESYYVKGDSITLRPASTNNFTMRPGYNYTYNIVMQTWTGQLEKDGCKVGTVPFTVSVVPDYVRWNPQASGNNNWNDADNWLGIDANNEPIHGEAHFVPMENTMVIIPTPDEGKPYPVVQPLPTVHEDSIQKVGFQYNQCNTIRFMPGAAIGCQQYISNNTDVVIDMQLPNKKWAFRTAPVNGMISGDLYMANADLNNETPLWEVGAFDAAGRSYKTGNGSFWLSVYNTETQKINQTGPDSTRTASSDWSKVTNALTLPLEEGKGFAIYARAKEGMEEPIVRLPKDDDTYYYYGSYGERIDSKYEAYLRNKRNELAGEGMAGKMIFRPVLPATSQNFTLTNGVSSPSFVFGNPTMGFIDIWGFIADNTSLLNNEFDYMDESGEGASLYTTVSESIATASPDTITNRKRYLPPMHAIVLKKAEAATSLTVTLNTNRVVTDVGQIVRPLGAPRRLSAAGLQPGIMTVIAKNPCSPRCTSHLLVGQGYHNGIREGEDAILTTINIDNYSNTNAPATPFNIYASEGTYGLSIDLRDEVLNIPIAFFISDLPYEPVTHLWFTGVNNIDGQLVLYDEWTNTERKIIDGICLTIETPTQSHQKRYFIRRMGYIPDESATETPITTGVEYYEQDDEQAVKIIREGHVLIIRNGHVYTMFGQKVR